MNSSRIYSKAGKSFSLVVKFCAGLTSIMVVITDLLSPIASFSIYIALALVLALAVLIMLHAIPPADRWLAERLEGYWMYPVVLTVIISSAMFMGAYFAGKQGGDDNGFLASQFPVIKEMQSDIGLIEQHTRAIVDNTTEIADNTEEIVGSTKNIDQTTKAIDEKVADLKKETSADPRKEIANLGLSWDIDDFSKSLMSGDFHTIELFLAGGMSPTGIRNGASVILYGMQPRLNNSPVGILKLMKKHGFNFDTHLSDAEILKHWNKSLPPYYKAENKPKGYAAYQKRFAGPLLMWVTILATYQGATEDDLKIINYLVSEGVEKETTIAYLDFTKSWLEDTRPYKEIRPLID